MSSGSRFGSREIWCEEFYFVLTFVAVVPSGLSSGGTAGLTRGWLITRRWTSDVRPHALLWVFCWHGLEGVFITSGSCFWCQLKVWPPMLVVIVLPSALRREWMLCSTPVLQPVCYQNEVVYQSNFFLLCLSGVCIFRVNSSLVACSAEWIVAW